jgi:Fe-S cluster assembly iron-binding protein IscA
LTFAIVTLVRAQTPASRRIRELLDRSVKELKGLRFYVKGQTSGGVAGKTNAESVVRHQTDNRIVIRPDRIDAVAIN